MNRPSPLSSSFPSPSQSFLTREIGAVDVGGDILAHALQARPRPTDGDLLKGDSTPFGSTIFAYRRSTQLGIRLLALQHVGT